MIPAQAVGLKEYFSGTLDCSAWLRKAILGYADEEDPASSLGHSGKLRVQHAPRQRIPAFFQLPEQGSKCPSSVLRQGTGDVFPNAVRWLNLSNSSDVLEHELSALIGESFSLSGDAECLAGASAHDDICFSMESAPIDSRHVAQIGNVRESCSQHGGREGVHLREGKRAKSQWLPCHACRLNPRKDGDVGEGFGT